MPLRNIRPLQILWQEGITDEMLEGVLYGVARILTLAGVFNEFKIERLGQRRSPNWLDPDGTPKPHQSLDWYIELARKNSTVDGYLNSNVLLDSLQNHPTYETEPRYELVVVKEPLHVYHDPNQAIIFGIGQQGRGSVISLYSLIPLLNPVTEETDGDIKNRQFYFWLFTQMVVMHEFGHVFDLFSNPVPANITDEEIKNSHCLDECVMYWWISNDLHEKIKDHPFCPSCLEKLKQYFIDP